MSMFRLPNVVIVLSITGFLTACDKPEAESKVAETSPTDSQEPYESNTSAVTDQVMSAIMQNSAQPRGAHDAYDPHSTLTVDQHIKVAIQHHQEGRISEAFNSLRTAIQQFPDNSELYFVQSQMFAMNDDTSQALGSIEQAIRLEPNNANYYINRAQFYRQFGRDDDAMADLNKSVNLNPDQVGGYFNRGALKYALNDLEGAVADFDQCIAIDPHESAPYFNRAAIHNELGNKAEAIADIERFLQISSNQSWNEVATGLLNQWKGETIAESNSEGAS